MKMVQIRHAALIHSGELFLALFTSLETRSQSIPSAGQGRSDDLSGSQLPTGRQFPAHTAILFTNVKLGSL